MILVDTSIWADHFRRSSTTLINLLESGLVSTHPMVIGELSCGNLPRRQTTLFDLHQLPRVQPAQHEEVLELIERHRLHGRGIGYVDANLMASALIEHHKVWTRDRRLATLCRKLDLAYTPKSNA